MPPSDAGAEGSAGSPTTARDFECLTASYAEERAFSEAFIRAYRLRTKPRELNSLSKLT